MALLRAVGHALAKVDAPADERVAKATALEFKLLKASRPEPKLYWGFIEDERNTVLKEYRFRAYRAAYGNAVHSVTVFDSAGYQFTAQPNRFGDVQIHLFWGGPFAGQSPVDVATQAIEWWKAHLDKLDVLSRT